MQVTVRLGEPYWRQAKTKEVVLELPAGATVGQLLQELARRYPELKQLLEDGELSPTVFLGDAIANPQAPLSEGDRPTLLWALAGG